MVTRSLERQFSQLLLWFLILFSFYPLDQGLAQVLQNGQHTLVPPYLVGDLGGDKQIDQLDALLLGEYLNTGRLLDCPSAADINGDHIIDSDDLEQLLILIHLNDKYQGNKPQLRKFRFDRTLGCKFSDGAIKVKDNAIEPGESISISVEGGAYSFLTGPPEIFEGEGNIQVVNNTTFIVTADAQLQSTQVIGLILPEAGRKSTIEIIVLEKHKHSHLQNGGPPATRGEDEGLYPGISSYIELGTNSHSSSERDGDGGLQNCGYEDESCYEDGDGDYCSPEREGACALFINFSLCNEFKEDFNDLFEVMDNASGSRGAANFDLCKTVGDRPERKAKMVEREKNEIIDEEEFGVVLLEDYKYVGESRSSFFERIRNWHFNLDTKMPDGFWKAIEHYHSCLLDNPKPRYAFEQYIGHGHEGDGSTGAKSCGYWSHRMVNSDFVNWKSDHFPVDRGPLLRTNYALAKGVCRYLVSDSSCYGGLTPKAGRSLNNSGFAQCALPVEQNCKYHCAQKEDLYISQAGANDVCNASVTDRPHEKQMIDLIEGILADSTSTMLDHLHTEPAEKYYDAGTDSCSE